MRAARYRLDPSPFDLDPRVHVAHPAPLIAGPDWQHDVFAEHFGQRTPEQMQQGQRQLIDANVVVFPIAAGRLQRPRIAFAAFCGAALKLQRAIAIEYHA